MGKSCCDLDSVADQLRKLLNTTRTNARTGNEGSFNMNFDAAKGLCPIILPIGGILQCWIVSYIQRNSTELDKIISSLYMNYLSCSI